MPCWLCEVYECCCLVCPQVLRKQIIEVQPRQETQQQIDAVQREIDAIREDIRKQDRTYEVCSNHTPAVPHCCVIVDRLGRLLYCQTLRVILGSIQAH